MRYFLAEMIKYIVGNGMHKYIPYKAAQQIILNSQLSILNYLAQQNWIQDSRIWCGSMSSSYRS